MLPISLSKASYFLPVVLGCIQLFQTSPGTALESGEPQDLLSDSHFLTRRTPVNLIELRKVRSSNPSSVEAVRQRTFGPDQSTENLLRESPDRPRPSRERLLDSMGDAPNSASHHTPTELIETNPRIRPDRALLTWEQRHRQRHDTITACTGIFAAIFAAGSIATSAASIYVAYKTASNSLKLTESQAASAKYGSSSAYYGNQLQAANLLMQNKQLEILSAQAAKEGWITPDATKAMSADKQPGQPLENYSMRKFVNPAILSGVDNAIGDVSYQVGHKLSPAPSGMYPPLFRKLKAADNAKMAQSAHGVSTKNVQAAKKAVDTALRKYDCNSQACPTCKLPSHDGKQKPCQCLKEAQVAIEAYFKHGMSGQPVPEPKLARKMGPSR